MYFLGEKKTTIDTHKLKTVNSKILIIIQQKSFKMLFKFVILFVAIYLVSVQGFAPAMKSRVASNTELNALFSLKPKEKSPTVTIEKTEKKTKLSRFAKPVAGKKEVEKKEVVKKEEKKNPFARFAKKPVVEEKEVTKKTPVKKVVAVKKTPVKKVVAVKKTPVKKVVAVKKAPVKKVVAVKKVPVVKKKAPVVKKAAKKIVKQTSASFKASTTKATKDKKKLVIYDRQCHIN